MASQISEGPICDSMAEFDKANGLDFFAQCSHPGGFETIEDITATDLYEAMKIAADRLKEKIGDINEQDGSDISIRVWRCWR